MSTRSSAGWYHVDLGDETFAWDACERIKVLFESAYAEAGSPPAMAMFLRRISGDVHCHVHAYFSPAAADVAVQLGGRPHAEPSPDNLTLLCGSSESWCALFRRPAP